MEEGQPRQVAVASQMAMLLLQGMLDLFISKEILSTEDVALIYRRVGRHAEGLGGDVNRVVAERLRVLGGQPDAETSTAKPSLAARG